MIFDALGDITTRKTGKHLDDVDNEADFSPYIIQRFLSMVHPSMAALVNRTTNRSLDNLDKRTAYNVFTAVVPRIPEPAFRYFKRKKTPYTKEDEDAIAFIGARLDIPRKRVIYYVEQFGIDLKKVKRAIT